MIEVEVKARAGPDILEKIRSLGAEPLSVEHHRDLYFNSPARDFKVTDEALRIRIKEEGARLTYKGPKLDSKTKSRKEITVKIDDPSAMEETLLALGFVKSGVVKKVRRKFSLGKAVIALDEVEGLGQFVEVEMVVSEDADECKADAGDEAHQKGWSSKRGEVMEILQALGSKESIRESYLELLIESGHII
jgi:adenylate cyclase class 2